MIDFHCHLDLYPNPREVVESCVARSVYVLSVTTTPSAWNGTAALAKSASRIWTGLGMHPQLAHERKSELPLFETLLSNTSYVGEIGLDGAPDFKAHWDDQVMVFDRILDLCHLAGGKILSIHSRRATTHVLDQLEAYPAAGIAILHWFSGSRRELLRAIDLGCWFSVGPAMMTGAKGRSLVSDIPRDRILTESDGPFAQINGLPILPWQTEHAIPQIAQIWNETAAFVEEQLLDNLNRLTHADALKAERTRVLAATPMRR